MRFAPILLGVILAAVSCSARTMSNEEISTFGGCYFAPVSSAHLWRMRDQDGKIREFEQVAGRKDHLSGSQGWSGQIVKDGVMIHSPANAEYPALDYHFVKGRLKKLVVEGKECRFSYPNPLYYEGETVAPLWPESKVITRDEFAEQTTMWKSASRIRLWFPGPNQAGAFCSFVCFLLLAGTLRARRRWWRLHLSTWTVGALVLVALTGSRGAILATVVGSVVMLACWGHVTGRLSGRGIAIGGLVVGMLALGALSATYLLGARSHQGDTDSDAQRKEVFAGALTMMHDAPGGWGDWNSIGRTYTDWYQPMNDTKVRLNLIGDQATTLVSLGYWKGGLYLAAWMIGMLFLLRYAWQGGSSVPAVTWLALGITSSLNVVMFCRGILVLPLLTLAVLAIDRRWMLRRCWLPAVLVGGGMACLTVAALAWAGERLPRRTIPLAHAGERTIANGSRTATWLVADADVLGLVNMPHDVRRFYSQFPRVPPLGIVRGLDGLPATPIHRLVLSGEWGLSFLTTFKLGLLPIALPAEIVFLAPNFAPSDIPSELRARANVRYVAGEFAARYYPGDSMSARWVKLVPGAETYIPGWMQYCFL